MKTDLVVAGYIYYNDKVLLVHHKKLDLWLPVGGHIEPNETPDEALHREVKEEVGLRVELIGKGQVFSDDTKGLIPPNYLNRHRISDTH